MSAGRWSACLCGAGLLVTCLASAQPMPGAGPEAAPAVSSAPDGAREQPAQEPRAEEPRAPEEPSELELSGFVGPSVVFGEPANPQYSPSVERIGALVAGAITYRSSYFIDPVLEVGHAWLATGRTELPSGPWGEGGTVAQELATWLLSPGISAEIWRLRARFGLGLGIVTQSGSFRGQQSTTSQLPLMSQLVVACKALDIASVQLDVEGRAVLASGADLSFVGLGISARFAALEFGKR
jgi:hypothetical protein